MVLLKELTVRVSFCKGKFPEIVLSLKLLRALHGDLDLTDRFNCWPVLNGILHRDGIF